MMGTVIWLLVAFLAVDAVDMFGKDNLPNSELPPVRPESIEAFKRLLHKALSTEGTYHRDLLITADILKAPPGYVIPKDGGSGIPQEMPLSPEMREYFNGQITHVLTSLEKLDYALNRLFGERLLTSHFMESKDSLDPKLMEHLNSYRSKNKECKESSPSIPELQSLPTVDFVTASESEFASEKETATSTSVVDEIATEYIKAFSEMPEPSTVSSNLHEVSLSEQADGVASFTALDDEFIMHLMSTSISHISNKPSFDPDESKAHFEKEAKYQTSTTDAATDFEATTETKSDSMPPSRKSGRVLTFEEVQILDKSLTLKPELKYHVISTFQEDLNPLSDIYFTSNDEIDDKTSSSKSVEKKRINPRGISLEDPIFYQAPTPQKMFLRYYRDIPDTSFTCENKPIPGFYADQETDCQVFHVCWPGRRESFLCPVGSLFNQQVLSCDNFNNTNCSLSHAYFDVNTAFQEFDDAHAQNVTPIPDPMMKPLQNDSGTTAIVTNRADIVELFEADLHFSDMVNKTNITELWDYLPVKAKVFVYPEPSDLKTFLAQHRHHKVRKSKDVRGQESSTDSEDFEDGEPDDVLEKRRRIEANIIRVLKKLSRKHRN